MSSTSVVCVRVEEERQPDVHKLRRRQMASEEEAFSMAIFDRSVETSSSSLNGDFLWFQIFVEALLRMHDHALAKQDLLNFVREQFVNDHAESRKIDEFDTNYTADTAIKWYTRDCFVYRLLNKALRLRDMNTLYIFRLLIIDIYLQLNKIKDVNSHLSTISHLYRGQSISRSETEQLRSSIGNYVSMNSFFSTSTDRQLSMVFAEARDGFEPVLFVIQADARLAHTKPFADISTMSYFAGEDETLFMLGAIFRLLSIEFEKEEQVWLLHMELCSDHESEIKPVLDNLKKNIEDKTDAYEIGRIMIEIGDMVSAKQYLKRFMDREEPNQGTMGGCYMLLGDIEMLQGNLDEAIDYHRQGLTLKQEYFAADHPYIPYSHNNLGNALRERGDFDEALQHFQQALSLWRQQYNGDMHENIALCFHNIGAIHGERDKFELALKHLTYAYEIMRVCLPPIHPRTAATLKCIGSLYGNMGKIELTENIFQQVLDIQRRCLPSNHVDLADTLYCLGVSHINSRRFDQALMHYEEAIGILRQTLPSTHHLCLQIEQDIAEAQAALTKE